MNDSQRLLDYIQNPEGAYAYFDIDVDYLYFITKKRNFDGIEDKIKFCEAIGNPCIINFGDITGYIPEFKPNEVILSEDAESITKKSFITTPLGEKSWILKQMKDVVIEKISEATSVPVNNIEDFQLFDWFYDIVEKTDWSKCIMNLRQKVDQIAGRAIPQIFLVPPFELLYWVKRQDLFLLFFDYPDVYMKVMDKIIDSYEIIINIAKEAGIQSVFYGAPGGTEFTSPATWEEAIVPTSMKLEKIIKNSGLYSLFHCCGKISTIIRKGFINQINPTIYETASPPVAGDVSNIGEIRELVDKKVITHGNIDLTFLKNSDIDSVKSHAIKILEQTEGYPHILGASDSCLWPGTPPQNLKVILDLFN